MRLQELLDHLFSIFCSNRHNKQTFESDIRQMTKPRNNDRTNMVGWTDRSTLLLVSLGVIVFFLAVTVTASPPRPYFSFSFSSVMNISSAIAPNINLAYTYDQDYEGGGVLLRSYDYLSVDTYVYYLVNVKTQVEVYYNTTNEACEWTCNNYTCCNRNEKQKTRTLTAVKPEGEEDHMTKLKNVLHSSLSPDDQPNSYCCTTSSKVYPLWAYYQQSTYAGLNFFFGIPSVSPVFNTISPPTQTHTKAIAVKAKLYGWETKKQHRFISVSMRSDEDLRGLALVRSLTTLSSNGKERSLP